MKTHKDLNVWKMSIDLVMDIYRITKAYPKEEQYGLVHQMKRAAVSVPSNIAEGAARLHPREFIQFLNIAKGSLSELETQLLISGKLDFVKEDVYTSINEKMQHIRRQIIGLEKYTRETTKS